jgi:hypothetical protein
LSVGEHAEARTGNLLGGLDDGAAELLSPLQSRGYVLDGDEKEHLILGALPRADRRIGRAFGSGVDERVARESALGRDLPAEQLAEEASRRVGVRGPDLNVNDGMSHYISYG